LYDEKIVAGKKFQSAEADYKSQRGLLSSFESQLLQIGISPSNVSKGSIVKTISIKSPINGFIHKIHVNTGSYVEPAKEIFMVVDNHHIHIDLHVFEKEIVKVKEGQTVFFTLSNAPETQYEAKIFAVGKAFETETRSVSVHADILGNKSKNLLPGMYVDGRIQVDKELVDALPDDAIISDGGLSYIFIVADSANQQKDAYSFKRVPVQTGVTDLGYTQITSLEKININAKYVTKGAYYLQAQMKQSQETGESHH
jgi:cobalt-zinc-cadmium efflux system membrane fusion protein